VLETLFQENQFWLIFFLLRVDARTAFSPLSNKSCIAEYKRYFNVGLFVIMFNMNVQ